MTDIQADLIIEHLEAVRLLIHAVACLLAFIAGVLLWRCVLHFWRVVA